MITLHWVRQTNWHKERLYRQLLSGNPRQQLRAASALAHLRAESYLLTALKSDTPAVRDLGRRALEHVWFNSGGPEAYDLTQAAFHAVEREDFQQALNILNRLIREFPNFAEGWNRRASVYWQMGQYEKSMQDCEKALFLNPNHYGAWQGIGICQLQMGEISEACRSLRAALKIIPYDGATRRSLQQCEELLRVFPHPSKKVKTIDLI
jgi:tetratricopeptide (TPR) repeat protein